MWDGGGGNLQLLIVCHLPILEKQRDEGCFSLFSRHGDTFYLVGFFSQQNIFPLERELASSRKIAYPYYPSKVSMALWGLKIKSNAVPSQSCIDLLKQLGYSLFNISICKGTFPLA